MDPDDIRAAAAELGELLAAGVARWSETPLVGLTAAALAPEVEALLLRQRAPLAAWLTAPRHEDDEQWMSRPDRWLRAQLVRWLRRRNQFIELDAAALAELGALCDEGLTAVGRALAGEDPRAGLRAALRSGRERLAALVTARLGPEPREVMSSEYSPALQLGVLGLRIEGLTGPALDVGCGPGAALVLALRAAGLHAEGIDRDAPASATVADWLRFDYGVDRWGTVISHLGFSLHLLHHHLAGRPAAFVHAEVYMQILRSLRTGGVFAYAPGLPFLERLLPREQYTVTRVALPQSPALRSAQDATGLSLGQATQVRRG